MPGKAAAAAAPHTPKAAGERPKTAATEPHEPPPPAAPAPLASPPSLLTLEQLGEFAQAKSSVERLAILTAALHVSYYQANPRSLVWVDWCFSVLTFALEEAQLSARKTLVLLRVANEVFDFATTPAVFSTISADGETATSVAAAAAPALPAVDAVYEVFRKQVRSSSVVATASDAATEPPIEDHDTRWHPADVAHIVSFMSSTFFRHLAAYQHVFRFPRQCLEREIALVVETPLVPTPLALATQE